MSEDVKLCAIVAMAKNRIIGGDNKLLWHLPEDLKHFKRTTMGKPLIMGRKTFESLPSILPGRPHIVISRSTPTQNTNPDALLPVLYYVKSIKEGISLAKKLAGENGQDEIFITGGGEIYKQTLPNIERLYLTIVHQDFEGDTVFPEIKWEDWQITSKTEYAVTDKHPAFVIYTLDKAQ